MIELTWEQVRRHRTRAHHLAARAPRDQWRDVVAAIGGLHAQMDSAAELALWNRVDGVQRGDLRKALWEDRTLVKTWAMRGTLHYIDTREFPALIAAHKITQTRMHKGAWLRYHGVTAGETQAILAAIPQALAGRALTRQELTREIVRITGLPHLAEPLASGWGALLKPAAFVGALCFGVEQGRNVTFVRPDEWLSDWREADPDQAFAAAFRRYATAYGPTTREDFERWWGAERRNVKGLLKRLADELVEVGVEGWKGLALAATVDEIAAAPGGDSVRLLPNFDPYVVSIYFHRERLMDMAFKDKVYRPQGWISPVALVNGWIAGVWSHEAGRSALKTQVEWFAPQPDPIRELAAAEAERLGAFFGLPVEHSETAG